MNRNTIVGLLLIAAIFIGWSLLMPSTEDNNTQQTEADSLPGKTEKVIPEEKAETTAETKTQAEEKETTQPEVKKVQETQAVELEEIQEQKQRFYYLENDLMNLTITNKGGRVRSVRLKNYVTNDSMPLVLFDSDSAIFGFDLSSSFNTTNQLFTPYFQNKKFTGDSLSVEDNDSIQFRMRLYPAIDEQIDSSKYIEYVYTVFGDEYMVDFSINLMNIQSIMTQSDVNLIWSAHLRQQEKTVDRWNAPTVYYKFYKDDVDYLSETENDKENLMTRVRWVSFKQHFFCSSIISKSFFERAKVEVFSDPKPTSPMYLKTMSATLIIPFTNQDRQSIDMSFYFGPLKYKNLRKHHMELERQIPLGWSFFLLAWINIYAVIPVFDFLGSFGWNYGIIILILTVLLKLVLFPIAYKMYKSSAKMRALKPEIEEIGKKFPKKEDSMKKQQATMALYKQAGVNPLAGCVPMLLQFPILIAMFRFFPSSIELRQKAFLWATDLSSYDSILSWEGNIPIISQFYGNHVSLFTLLMTVSTIFYTKMNNQMMSSGQQMPGMKVMMYFMPVMFLGIFNNYASALSYYYFLANVITFGQMYVFRAFIDEKKLRQQIQLAKKKPKKKSGFMKRLEEAQKRRGYPPPKKRK